MKKAARDLAKKASLEIPQEIKITKMLFQFGKTFAHVETPEFREVLYVTGKVKDTREFYALTSWTITRMRSEVRT